MSAVDLTATHRASSIFFFWGNQTNAVLFLLMNTQIFQSSPKVNLLKEIKMNEIGFLKRICAGKEATQECIHVKTVVKAIS